MQTMRVETPRLDPLVAALVFQLRNKNAFVKNWANSVAIEARENARKKGGRRYWSELARSIRVRSISYAVRPRASGEIGTVSAFLFTGTISPPYCLMTAPR